MIAKLACILFISVPAAALTVLEMNTALSRSIEDRVKIFKGCGAPCTQFLEKTAFDVKAGLQPRWRSVTTMGRLDGARFAPQIERALKSKEWFMRNAALIASQTSAPEFCIQWSMRLVTDPALVVRTQAVRNLVRLEAREAEPLLWREIFSVRNFHDRQGLWVRAHMAEALAKFTTPGKSRLFKKLLDDSDVRLHKWAVLGLENTTGFKMTTDSEPLELRRQKWQARLSTWY